MKTGNRIDVISKWLLAAFVFVAAVEACLQVDDWLRWGAPVATHYSEGSLRFVDELGFRNRPGAEFQKWKINEHGFRGPALSQEKAEGKTRVAVLGASETFGLFESEGLEFPAQLADYLNANGDGGFEVINAAVAGTDLLNQRDLYRDWVSSFDPDIVIVYPSPSFYLMDGGAGGAAPPMTEGSGPRWGVRLPSRARARVKQFVPRPLIGLKNRWLVKQTVDDRPEGWQWTEVPMDRVGEFHTDLEEIAQTILDSGAHLVLSTHANKFSPESPYAQDPDFAGWWRYMPRADSAALIQTVVEANHVVRSLEGRRGVTVVDLEAVVGGKVEYFADANHFTDAGSGAVAETLGRAILENVRRPDTTVSVGSRP